MLQMAFKDDNYDMNSLPDELLLEIFNYFDGENLKNILQVSRRWHDVIVQSASTMKHLPFNSSFFNSNPGNELNRNFYAANIFHLDNIDTMNIVNHSLQALDISFCRFSAEELKLLLIPFDQLKYLTLKRVQIKSETLDYVAQGIVLKKLEVIQTDHKVFNVFKNYQTLNLEIIDGTNQNGEDFLLNFLKSQKELKSLKIEELLATNPCKLFVNDLKSNDFKFKLNKFSILFSSNYTENFNFERNFINFLNNQLEFLNELKVGGQLPNSIYKHIILNLNNLKILDLTADKFPQEKLFYEEMKLNNLDTLKIQSTITQNNFLGLKHFLNFCKNLQKLILNDTDVIIANDLYSTISLKLVNLKNLSVLNFASTFDPLHSNKSLTCFSIKILNNVDQWLKFILLHNEKLEAINVGWMQRDFDVYVIEQIINLTRIKYMKFGGRFIANKRIYDAVKNDYKNLRVLELRVSNYDEIKNLKFIFPQDKKDFNPKCLYFEENNDREPLND